MPLLSRLIALAACSAIALSSASAAEPEGSAHSRALYKRLSAVAASSGNAELKYNLGMFLNNGIGTPRDKPAAFQLFTEAAEAGHPLAAYKVGCYLAGQFPGVVAVNEEEALKYKLHAAEAGYELAQFDVGMLYAKKRELATALMWWERASRQGSFPATAYLANYLSGEGSPEPIKAYAVLLVAKDLAPKTTPELLERLAKLEANLSLADKQAAQTLHAKSGASALPALLDSLER